MLDTSTAKIQQPRDFGQQIAVEYWRRTLHVFSRQGPKNPNCGLCLLPELGEHSCRYAISPGSGPDCDLACWNYHIEPEPYPAQPTIVSITSNVHVLSCGHGPVHIAAPRGQTPNVGDSYDCMSCRMDVNARNQPGLPDEIRAQIEAQLPKCPTCGEGIAKIPFIKRTVHSFEADVDFQTGEINAGSEDYDTLEEGPDWVFGTQQFTKDDQAGEVVVVCENKHSFTTNRLIYSHERGEAVWHVAGPEPQP